MNINVKNILEVCKECNAKLLLGDESIECKNFSKDTRTIKQGNVYVGIKGENFDGNTLYEDALEKGAKVCLIQITNESNIEIDVDDISKKYNDRAVIVVDDSIKALQLIASYKRSLYDIPVIAITGSVGKTSTKDIVASVVATKYAVHKTQGNLNNHIGVPLTLLQLDNHEALVVEMGMNNLGEISTLSKIAKPNVAIITNVGTAHIGNLGSRENIRKAKLEILDGLAENGTLIINNDNDMLHDWYMEIKNNSASKFKICTYGIENESDVMAEDIDMHDDSSYFNAKTSNTNSQEIVKIKVPIGGIHFVYNALCAMCVGSVLNIEPCKIADGIAKFELSKSRMELINLKNNVKLINDCYNANYDSMKAAIDYLSKTAKARKIAILGDMLELGEYSNNLHAKVGEEIINKEIDILITVGQMGKVIAQTVNECEKSNTKVYACDSNQEAIDIIERIKKCGDTILVKASNGMKFKEIVSKLEELDND